MKADLHSYARTRRAQVFMYLFIIFLSLIFVSLQYVGSSYSDLTADTPPGSAVEQSGVASSQALGARYDSHQSATRSLATLLSISKDELEQSQESSFLSQVSSDPMVEWSLSPTSQSFLSNSSSPEPLFALKDRKNNRTFYGHLFQPDTKKQVAVLSSNSRSKENFAVIKKTGNFLSSYKTAIRADSCPKLSAKLIFYTSCPLPEYIQTSLIVRNTTYKTEAQFIKSHPSDRLTYSLRVKNTGNKPLQLFPEIYLGDIREYALLENGTSGNFDKKTKALSWPHTVLPPQAEANYSFDIQILRSVPLVAQNNLDRSSFDCRISTYFGTVYSVALACPSQKVMERFIHLASNPTLIAFAWTMLGVTIFLFLRSYILYKELVTIIEIEKRK